MKMRQNLKLCKFLKILCQKFLRCRSKNLSQQDSWIGKVQKNNTGFISKIFDLERTFLRMMCSSTDIHVRDKGSSMLICSPVMIWKWSVNVCIVKVKFLKSKIFEKNIKKHLLILGFICLLYMFHTWLQNTRKNIISLTWTFPPMHCYPLTNKMTCKYPNFFLFSRVAQSSDIVITLFCLSSGSVVKFSRWE